VGEHGHHGADIRGLPCFDEANDDLTQPLISDGAQGGLLALRGQRSSAVLCARCSAVSTAAVISSVVATSFAENPSTSRRISTARCLAGMCWSAGANASSMHSRCSHLALGTGSSIFELDTRVGVRIRLHPDGLDEWLRERSVAEVDREHSLRLALDHLQTGVGRDPV
jgi:hypothetical protein